MIKLYHTIVEPNGNQYTVETEKVDKLWGSEHIVTNTEKYCAKVMTMNPKTQVSLHYHMEKEETFILISGKLVIKTVDGSKGKENLHYLNVIGDALTLKPGTPHTFFCPTDQIGPTVFIEASTQDFKDDSYRIYPSRGQDTDSGGSNN